MVKLIWRTDVHLSDRAPQSRTDDWATTVFDKLSRVRDLAARVSATAIIDGGDFFHVKAPSRNSHELVRRTAEHHAGYPCPVYCVPGNHDCSYGDYTFLPQQPLGVLYAAGVFRPLYDQHEAVFIQDGVKVRVVGVPYHGTSYDMSRFTGIKRGDEDFLICAAHVLASKQGGTMFEGEDIIKYSDLLDTAPDAYFFGHWHKDQGIENMGGKTFVNVGSLTRGTLSQDDLNRQPACVVLTAERGKPLDFKVARLRVAPPADVFDLEGRNRQVKHQEDMEAFVGHIRDALVPVDAKVSLFDVVRNLPDLSSEVRERALAYLEKA